MNSKNEDLVINANARLKKREPLPPLMVGQLEALKANARLKRGSVDPYLVERADKLLAANRIVKEQVND